MHPVGVRPVTSEADAQQHVVRIVILITQEVRVVGGDDGKPEVIAKTEDLRVQLRLSIRIVPLDLEVVPPVEQVRVPLGGLTRSGVVSAEQVLCDLARHARR